MNVKSDHRSKFSNLSNWNVEAWKKSGLQRDSNPWHPRIPVRCSTNWAMKPDIGSEINLLSSYFPLQWSVVKYIWNNSYLYCSCRWMWRVIIAVNFPISACIWTQLIDLAPTVWLHSSVGRASHRYRGGHRFESRWSPDFFQTSTFQLLKLENLLGWSLFTDNWCYFIVYK